MKHPFASMIVVAALAASPVVAHAGDGSDDRGWAGAEFEIIPSGSVAVNAGGSTTTTSDLKTAYAVSLVAEKDINELISVGFAPRYAFGLIGVNDNGDTSQELDLRARISVGHTIIPKLRLFGFAEPGYSIVFVPQTVVVQDQHYHPNGFVVDLGGGASYALSGTLRATFDLGYEAGFQTWSVTYTVPVIGTTVNANGDFKVSYLHFGFGLTAAFD
jgi:hypothetical protein